MKMIKPNLKRTALHSRLTFLQNKQETIIGQKLTPCSYKTQTQFLEDYYKLTRKIAFLRQGEKMSGSFQYFETICKYKYKQVILYLVKWKYLHQSDPRVEYFSWESRKFISSLAQITGIRKRYFSSHTNKLPFVNKRYRVWADYFTYKLIEKANTQFIISKIFGKARIANFIFYLVQLHSHKDFKSAKWIDSCQFYRRNQKIRKFNRYLNNMHVGIEKKLFIYKKAIKKELLGKANKTRKNKNLNQVKVQQIPYAYSLLKYQLQSIVSKFLEDLEEKQRQIQSQIFKSECKQVKQQSYEESSDQQYEDNLQEAQQCNSTQYFDESGKYILQKPFVKQQNQSQSQKQTNNQKDVLPLKKQDNSSNHKVKIKNSKPGSKVTRIKFCGKVEYAPGKFENLYQFSYHKSKCQYFTIHTIRKNNSLLDEFLKFSQDSFVRNQLREDLD